MLVELDIFSGRPNPRWELDEHDARRLLRLQSGLRKAGHAPPEPPALGYRGFVYRDAGAPSRAYKGFVSTPRGVLADPSLSVERFLLELLPGRYAAVRGAVESELRK